MLLFSSDNKSSSSIVSNAVLIISTREHVINDICSQLTLKDISSHIKIHQNITEAESISAPDNIKGIVVDIGSVSDAQLVMDKINMLLPKSVGCVVLGDSDSIVLAQQFMDHGIFFLHYPSQKDRLVERLQLDPSTLNNKRQAIKFGIFSCKGGVGGSTIAYHISKLIGEHNKVPVLLLQGQGGSTDIDLIANKEVKNGVAKIDNYLSVKCEDETNAYSHRSDEYENENFVVMDYTIHNIEKDRVESLLQHADCVVLVVNADLASLRVAKSAIASNRFLNTVNGGVKRLFICLNNPKSTQNSVLSYSDLSQLLGQDFSSVVPYQRPESDPTKPFLFQGKAQSAIRQLTLQILGMNDGNQGSLSKSFSRFFTVMRK